MPEGLCAPACCIRNDDVFTNEAKRVCELSAADSVSCDVLASPTDFEQRCYAIHLNVDTMISTTGYPFNYHFLAPIAVHP